MAHAKIPSTSKRSAASLVEDTARRWFLGIDGLKYLGEAVKVARRAGLKKLDIDRLIRKGKARAQGTTIVRRGNPRDLAAEAVFRGQRPRLEHLMREIHSVGAGIGRRTRDEAWELDRVQRANLSAARETTRYSLEGKRPPRPAFVKRMAKSSRARRTNPRKRKR